MIGIDYDNIIPVLLKQRSQMLSLYSQSSLWPIIVDEHFETSSSYLLHLTFFIIMGMFNCSSLDLDNNNDEHIFQNFDFDQLRYCLCFIYTAYKTSQKATK